MTACYDSCAAGLVRAKQCVMCGQLDQRRHGGMTAAPEVMPSFNAAW